MNPGIPLVVVDDQTTLRGLRHRLRACTVVSPCTPVAGGKGLAGKGGNKYVPVWGPRVFKDRILFALFALVCVKA